MKKIKGGSPGEGGAQEGLECMGGFECCTAHNTNGSGTDHSFCINNDALMDSWKRVWQDFGYSISCHIRWWT